MNKTEDTSILKQLTDVFDRLSINYAIGGSIASSIYGRVRFTQDADITLAPFFDKAEQLYNLLEADFYISKDAMYEALKNLSSFNIIHFKSAFKIDIFIRKNDEFQKDLLNRRRAVKLDENIDKSFSIVSPEDIILLKLQWYQSSGKISEKQWSDVLGVIAVQKDNLDFNYLKKWAIRLNINDLLQNAIKECS